MENNEKQIYKSLCAIQKEIGAIGKNKRSPGVSFAYRGIDDVMNELHPLLAEYGVTIVPEVVDHKREERLTTSGKPMIFSIMTIRYHFVAIDGSEVVATVVGEGQDLSDKASNKAMAIAYKYACFQVFCIPTEEMAKADPDGYQPEASKPTADQLRTYVDNCATIDDFKTMKDAWGVYIKGDADLSAYANAKYNELKNGAQR